MFINTFHFSAVAIAVTVFALGLWDLFRMPALTSRSIQIDEEWSTSQCPPRTKTYMTDIAEGALIVGVVAVIAGLGGTMLLLTTSQKKIMPLIIASCATGMVYALMRLWHISLRRRVMQFYHPTIPPADVRRLKIPLLILLCYSAGTLVGLMR